MKVLSLIPTDYYRQTLFGDLSESVIRDTKQTELFLSYTTQKVYVYVMVDNMKTCTWIVTVNKWAKRIVIAFRQAIYLSVLIDQIKT